MFEEEAKRSFNCKKVLYKWETDKCSYIDGFKDGAKSREKRIAELESQIEKMKCCGNCAGFCDSDDVARFCKDNEYKLWEMKENEILY